MTTFTIVVLSDHVWKSSQVLPAHVALPMHLPGIFYTGVKVQIPLAICNQYHIYNLAAEVRTLGRIVTFFQLLVLLQAPKPIDRSITQTQEWFMHASFSILTCRLPKNMNQPLELQLGLLGPANFAHPRSQSNRMGTRLPSLKHILALHTSATSTAGVSAGVSAFTYRHKHGTVNNLWILCHFQPTNFTYIPSICTAKYTLKAL